MKKTLLAAVAALLPALSAAEPLWGKVEAGASLADIQAAYPEGRPIEPGPKQKIQSGATLRYLLPTVPVVGESFKAEFFLQEGKLEQVNLSLDAAKNDLDCRHTMVSVAEALTAKYGDPIKRDSSSTSTNLSWSSGKTTVSLFGMSFGPVRSCMVSIAYNQRIAASAENL